MTGAPSLVGGLLAGGYLQAAPSDQEFDSVSVSPGLPAFYVMFALAVAVVLLALDLTRRVRRIQARERAEQRLEAEDADAASSQDTPSDEDAGSARGAADDADGPDAGSNSGGRNRD